MKKFVDTKRAMKPWTSREINQLLEYKSTGFNNYEIAELMERSPKAIQVKMSKMRKDVDAAVNSSDLTPFQKNLDSTLFGDVAPNKPRKPRTTRLSLSPPTDTFNVPKRPVYAAIVFGLVIAAWYLGSMS